MLISNWLTPFDNYFIFILFISTYFTLKGILFYLLYPICYLLSLLPFWALYGLSDILFFLLYYIIRYRKKVILKNLNNAFPEKSPQEIHLIHKKFVAFLCDVSLETLKLLSISKQTLQKRCTFDDLSKVQQLYEEGKSFIVVMGHYGNWEWGGPAFVLHSQIPLLGIYRPLSDPYFSKMVAHMRTRHGMEIAPEKNTIRQMVSNRKRVTATALIADQTPTYNNASWLEFLQQETAVFKGPEKLAQKFNYPVVFMSIERVKRGYYKIFSEILCKDSKGTQEGEITAISMQKLEEKIKKQPETWLWSHKRWKHRRKEDMPMIKVNPSNH